ncbi:hypothetical protein [Streptococcus merionis]|uniref:Uncharacterized protein n=1 Tax=Streptococcus merionis TaxID=400065 RepID=A0A239T0B8_9STRE|nr:hypothetical protein [Streptococcus merionis]SNU91225.1 Uncharacterised protein [Streptococcus merionis]
MAIFGNDASNKIDISPLFETHLTEQTFTLENGTKIFYLSKSLLRIQTLNRHGQVKHEEIIVLKQLNAYAITKNILYFKLANGSDSLMLGSEMLNFAPEDIPTIARLRQALDKALSDL